MEKITTQQTVDEINKLQLFTSLRQHEAEVSYRLKELGIRRKDIVFNTSISAGVLSSSMSMNEHSFRDSNPVLIAENIIDTQSEATPGYNGDTIKCNIVSRATFNNTRVCASAALEVSLPLEYIGILVAIGRLKVTNASVACGM